MDFYIDMILVNDSQMYFWGLVEKSANSQRRICVLPLAKGLTDEERSTKLLNDALGIIIGHKWTGNLHYFDQAAMAKQNNKASEGNIKLVKSESQKNLAFEDLKVWLQKRAEKLALKAKTDLESDNKAKDEAKKAATAPKPKEEVPVKAPKADPAPKAVKSPKTSTKAAATVKKTAAAKEPKEAKAAKPKAATVKKTAAAKEPKETKPKAATKKAAAK